MLPIARISADVCTQLVGIFCDIDDTLTRDGKLLASAYDALWRARTAGLKVVPVTGRPAGWVDHIARMWPVDAVVGENGAFVFWLAGKQLRRHFFLSEHERAHNRDKLRLIEQEISDRFPAVRVASDQAYRANDLAIDFAEEVTIDDPALPARIVDVFEAHGATAKISSIHVNGWFGQLDKLTGARYLVHEIWQQDATADFAGYLYVGDSPNDEPLFSAFRTSAGVANIAAFADTLQSLPTYVARHDGGDGFAEIVDAVLSRRG